METLKTSYMNIGLQKRGQHWVICRTADLKKARFRRMQVSNALYCTHYIYAHSRILEAHFNEPVEHIFNSICVHVQCPIVYILN